MCGIAGIFSHGFQNDFHEQLVKMSDTIANRGPDDEGCWYDYQDGIGLAHRRLSIIDLSQSGHQPMLSPSGRYVIVFNGEIYNYKEIKKSLESQDIEWKSDSDTEVMLAAIDTWGIEKAVTYFNGMFAFGLWDKKKRVLSLCRDRLGIKPLYYAKIKKGILFGSELKAIKAHPDFNPVISQSSLGAYLRYNYVPAPDTIYKNTWKLKPGNIIHFTQYDISNENFKESLCYWDIKKIAKEKQLNPFKGTEAEAIDQLDDLLVDSIKKRMISDVPIGAFLSGGIDSSTIVSIMQSQITQKVNTFSIGFNVEGYNEAVYARKIAKYLGTNHTELYLNQQDVIDVIPKLPAFYDEPFSDSSQIPTYLVSKLAKQTVTVSLSGDGGDELFGGYNRHFLIPYIWNRIEKIHPSLRKFGSNVLQLFSPVQLNQFFYKINILLPQNRQINRAGDKLDKLSEILPLTSPDAIYESLCSIWKNPENVIINPENKAKHSGMIFDVQLSGISNKTMFLDLISYLPDDILTKIDRATMAESLEGRVPILDHRIVEFAWSLPLEFKIRKNKGKLILRNVLNKYLPHEYVDRPKSGFSIPIDSWLRGDLLDWAENLLDKKRLISQGFFNASIVRKKWDEHLSKKRNWQYQLWNILMFQSWLEEYNN